MSDDCTGSLTDFPGHLDPELLIGSRLDFIMDHFVGIEVRFYVAVNETQCIIAILAPKLLSRQSTIWRFRPVRTPTFNCQILLCLLRWQILDCPALSTTGRRAIQAVYSLWLRNAVGAVKRGDRVAQLILERIVTPPVEEVTGSLEATVRGAGGHGSTGVWKSHIGLRDYRK